jgi:hypothetical protein
VTGGISLSGTRMSAWRNGVMCWDKDSTLAFTQHRQWMVPEIKAGKLTWDDYAAACADDQPNEAALALMRHLAPSYGQVVMSGASDCPQSRQWLEDYAVPCDASYFRPHGDKTENGLLKVRWIEQLRDFGIKVLMFFEDWPETAEVIRQKTGVLVLVVNPCYDSGSSWGHRATLGERA